MNNTPFFSIIIPTYNRASILPRAIESVIDQAFSDWELIIVDDGSVDDTKKAVQTSFQDDRIRYHWQENKELNGARNTGVELATGQYLLFLDDDDAFLPTHLSVLFEFVKKNKFPEAAIRTGLFIQSKNSRVGGVLYDNTHQSAVAFLWHHPVNLLSFAFHKRIFNQIRFDEGLLLGDDFHFLMRVFFDYELIQIPEFTVVYHQHDMNRTVQYYQPKHLEHKLKAMEVLWQEYEEELSPHISVEEVKIWKANQELHFARTAFRHEDRPLGWRYLREALKGFTIGKSRSFLRTVVLGLFGV